jgi:hypothetical protein
MAGGPAHRRALDKSTQELWQLQTHRRHVSVPDVLVYNAVMSHVTDIPSKL